MTTRVPHINISNPPCTPPPPSVPLPHLFTHWRTTPPSTSRVGPTDVSGHHSPGLWSGGAHDTRKNHEGAPNAHVHHGERRSTWASHTWQLGEAGGGPRTTRRGAGAMGPHAHGDAAGHVVDALKAEGP